MNYWSADLKNGEYKNPILHTDYSDPDVIAVNGEFYMIASSFTYLPGVPLLHSRDLVNWELINYCVKSIPFEGYDRPVHGSGTWAPAIRYHDGWFYVFVPVSYTHLMEEYQKYCFDGSAYQFVSTFLENQKLSDEDVKKLKELLDEYTD